jgi:hypothetical protein
VSDGDWFWVIIGAGLGAPLVIWAYHVIRGTSDKDAEQHNKEK